MYMWVSVTVFFFPPYNVNRVFRVIKNLTSASDLVWDILISWVFLDYFREQEEMFIFILYRWCVHHTHPLYSLVILVFKWKMSRELWVCSWLPCRIYVTSAAQEGGARAFPAAWRRQTYVAAKSSGQKSLFIEREGERGPYTSLCSMSSVPVSLTATTHLLQYIISLWLQPRGAKWQFWFTLDIWTYSKSINRHHSPESFK